MNFLGHFYPHWKETLRTVRLKEGVFVFSLIIWLATLTAATYIMANKAGVVTKPGVPADIIASIVKLSGKDLNCESSEVAGCWLWGEAPTSSFSGAVRQIDYSYQGVHCCRMGSLR